MQQQHLVHPPFFSRPTRVATTAIKTAPLPLLIFQDRAQHQLRQRLPNLPSLFETQPPLSSLRSSAAATPLPSLFLNPSTARAPPPSLFMFKRGAAAAPARSLLLPLYCCYLSSSSALTMFFVFSEPTVLESSRAVRHYVPSYAATVFDSKLGGNTTTTPSANRPPSSLPATLTCCPLLLPPLLVNRHLRQ